MSPDKDLPQRRRIRLALGLPRARGVLSRGPGSGISGGALKKTGGNKAKAARILGVGRATLYRFLDKNPDAKDIAASFH